MVSHVFILICEPKKKKNTLQICFSFSINYHWWCKNDWLNLMMVWGWISNMCDMLYLGCGFSPAIQLLECN